MRESLTVEVDVRRFRAWRIAVILVASAAAASLATWAFSRQGMSLAASWLVAALGAAGSAWVARSLTDVAGGRLRGAGGGWSFSPGASDGVVGTAVDDGADAVELEVAMDLGSFMLLRLSPAPGAAGRRVRWLPVERAGIESRWQALRCAVYAPRPAAPADLVADPGRLE